MTNTTNQKATKDDIYELVKVIRQERYEEEAKTTETDVKKLPNKKELKAEIEDLFLVIKKLLRDGIDVPMTDIGTLKVKERASRKGRNPQTGAELEIKGRRAVGFTESASLKKEFKAEQA